jgi:steroid 5-alpha reductase family enzyme
MPASHNKNRATSPPAPNPKIRPAAAAAISSSSSSATASLESNQVVVWAVYCCIAIGIVLVGCYTFGNPMLVRAFPNNTADMNGRDSDAAAVLNASRIAYYNAVEAYKTIQGEGALSGEKMRLLQLSLYAALAAAALVFGVGEATGNYSQVDKLWSILPVLYTFFYAYYSGYNRRLLLQSACTLAWGARLTYNFAKKDGYHWPRVWEGEEDYRWPVLRAKIPAFQNKTVWRVFHLLFIALYQNILLWVITVPAVAAWTNLPLNRYDFLAAAAMLFFIYIETVADHQQNSFQARKRAAAARGDRSSTEVQIGFVTEGLWSYCRHPNYCCEQGIWFAYYCFSVSSSKTLLNVTILGPLLLVSLFAASARFTEQVCPPFFSRSLFAHYHQHSVILSLAHPRQPDRMRQVSSIRRLRAAPAHVPPLRHPALLLPPRFQAITIRSHAIISVRSL